MTLTMRSRPSLSVPIQWPMRTVPSSFVILANVGGKVHIFSYLLLHSCRASIMGPMNANMKTSNITTMDAMATLFRLSLLPASCQYVVDGRMTLNCTRSDFGTGENISGSTCMLKGFLFILRPPYLSLILGSIKRVYDIDHKIHGNYKCCKEYRGSHDHRIIPCID